MGTDLTPDEIRGARFRTVLRGVDGKSVEAFLDRVAADIEELEEQLQGLTERLGEYADRDLESEFDSIGREVAAVLQTAREAADSMRERASLDAARWRSESMVEAEQLRKEARSDAEALRGDAWSTGSELLTQTLAEVNRLRQEAERDVLTVMGEAEREAHRLTSVARREAEDMARGATMDAEKMTSEATKRRDDLIEQASRQAEAAQERTRALEERREELLEELENVRSTLGRLEGTLEERRDHLDLSGPVSSVKVVPSITTVDPLSEDWKPGETVRIVSHGAEPDPLPPVSRPEPPATPERAPETEPVSSPEPVQEPEPAEVQPSQPPPEPTTDEVDALFASLRSEGAVATVEADIKPSAEEEKAEEPVPAEPKITLSEAPDLIANRDSVLLPISNRALRGVKKAVTESQNIALDSLRTDESWQPDKADLADLMRADLIGLWAESYAAGHDVAEGMVGAKLKRKDTPTSAAADEFGDDLAAAVNDALATSGKGQRERQSATSRVFRGWRADEAERRIRRLALEGFHHGVVDSAPPDAQIVWVPAGTPCSACREAAADPVSSPPPIHAGCECTLRL
jgi:DivIVA domain-containing protein